MSMRRSLPRIALTLVLTAIAGWVVLHRDQINLATLDAWLVWLGPWAPIGHMMLFALGTVAFVPGVVFSLAGGALFGPFWAAFGISQVPRSAPPLHSWLRGTSRENGSHATLAGFSSD
jgi:uncharacterized membrane protein YdjX (TVP38/TMEM64 family)